MVVVRSTNLRFQQPERDQLACLYSLNFYFAKNFFCERFTCQFR